MKFLKELWTLMVIELKTFRVVGLGTTVVVLGIPFGAIIIILMLSGGAQSWGILYIGGGITLIISNLCLVFLAQRLIYLRKFGGVQFFYTLPISPISLPLAILLAHIILVIPMIFFFLLISSLIFQLKMTISFWLLLIIILSILSFMGIGGIIGLYPKNYQRAENLSTILMFVVMFGTPIFWPAQLLPHFVQVLQRFFPFIYSVEGIRLTLGLNSLNLQIYTDVIFLGLFAIVSQFLFLRFNLWQER
ncbi:MAG: ABC transporter permease [bacterium]